MHQLLILIYFTDTFNKKSMQEGNEESTSNENGEIELNKQADEGYKQRYPEKELFEGGRLKKIIKRLYQYLKHFKY